MISNDNADPQTGRAPEGDDAEAPQAEAQGAAAADETADASDTLQRLEAENAELRDRVLRLAAEQDNLRKRTEREIAETRSYAIASFARDMLAAADSLDRALAALPEEARQTQDGAIRSLIEGIEMTDRELQRLLAKNGVSQIAAKGQRFDPHRHQAMYEVPDPSVPEGTVVQVMQAGFSIGDRILRPAMVGVAKGGPKPGAPATDGDSDAADDAPRSGGVDRSV